MDFISHLKKYLTDEEINKLIDSLELEDLHALLLNEEKMDEKTLLSIYPHLRKHPIVPNGYLYDKNEYKLSKSLLYELGVFYLQEPSAMLVSYLLSPNKNDIVLDLCAAPGGKSIGASYLMKGTGLIISNDISINRAKIIKENAEVLGLKNLLIVSNDFSSISYKFKNYFDCIILDAPCSGSGMFRKNDLVKEDWSINKVYKFASIQKELILMSYNMLKEGGKLIYSTCSFSYEEDEEVIKYLLDNTNAKLLQFYNNPQFYQSKDKIGIHLFPYLFPGEGHYIALISKEGNKNETHFKEKKSSNLYDGRYLIKQGAFSYLSNYQIDTTNFNVIRNGIKLGEMISKDEIKYDLHYARSLSNFSLELEINKEETIRYIEGNSLNIKIDKGYILLKYMGVPIDIAKSDGNIIKNRYPKYLRKKIDINN